MLLLKALILSIQRSTIPLHHRRLLQPCSKPPPPVTTPSHPIPMKGPSPMASAPAAELPILFNDLTPLSSDEHKNWTLTPKDTAPFLKTVHAVPLSVDEFVAGQHHFPIVFSVGDQPVPIALFGLNEGVNVYLDDDGRFTSPELYVPAYIRRYPFMLARLNQSSDQLSLCMDPSFDGLEEGGDGQRLFDGDQPTDLTKNILAFAEQYEQSAGRTAAFVDELEKAGLMMDGEVTIEVPGQKPFVYRGFKMVNEEKLRDLRGDQLRKWNTNGILGMIYAHLFSLPLITNVFNRAANSGRIPGLEAGQAGGGAADSGLLSMPANELTPGLE